MNKINTSGLVLSALFLTACGGSSETKTAVERFKPVIVDEEIVIQDSQTGLEWVNGLSPNSNKGVTGCNPMPSGLSTDGVIMEAENFCENLSFGTHNDWRVPTTAEIKKYTVDIDAAGIIPFYQNPSCPRVVGIDINGAVKTPSTVNTHNTNPVGGVNAWASKNAGARCVRAN